MIDLSKIKIGDEIDIRMRVTTVGFHDHDLEFCCRYDDSERPVIISSRAHSALIISHTPVPRDFKPGDRVEWMHGPHIYTFVGEFMGTAALARNGDVWAHPPLSELRHPDESE